MKKLDGFQKWIAEEILKVMPGKYFERYQSMSAENKSLLYEMTCTHACLRPESPDVIAAFKSLVKEAGE